MSGHSKWATIRRKKEKIDNKRGQVFTKLIKEITVAARLGGSNEEANPRLKVAIQKAKSANMPLDNIKKAKLKGAGELPGVVYDEISYEGYGPGGVAVYVECMTDNKIRTVGEVRHAFSKHGGNLGETGSVNWMFNRKGMIVIDGEGLDEDTVMEDVIEMGAEDFKNEDGKYFIYTEFEDYFDVLSEVEKKYTVEDSEITMIAENMTKVPEEKVNSFIKMIDMLEDLDDVQNVYSNADIDDDDLEDA